MAIYSYDMITVTLQEHIEQVASVVRGYISEGKRDEAWNLAYSLWGAFRLWERITNGDRPDGEAPKLEHAIEKLLAEAKYEAMNTTNVTYADVTDATENFIRELFANNDPLPVAELNIRRAIAKTAVKAWHEEAQGLTLREVHESEHLRLEELAFELPAGGRVSE